MKFNWSPVCGRGLTTPHKGWSAGCPRKREEEGERELSEEEEGRRKELQFFLGSRRVGRSIRVGGNRRSRVGGSKRRALTAVVRAVKATYSPEPSAAPEPAVSTPTGLKPADLPPGTTTLRSRTAGNGLAPPQPHHHKKRP